jgi:hypothetical protein
VPPEPAEAFDGPVDLAEEVAVVRRLHRATTRRADITVGLGG